MNTFIQRNNGTTLHFIKLENEGAYRMMHYLSAIGDAKRTKFVPFHLSATVQLALQIP